MARKNELGEPHPLIPHLYQKPQPRTAAETVYPYLKSSRGPERVPAKAQAALTKGLIPDQQRGSVSPLGGVARRSK
jgi:hypothetical protein